MVVPKGNLSHRLQLIFLMDWVGRERHVIHDTNAGRRSGCGLDCHIHLLANKIWSLAALIQIPLPMLMARDKA
jgi:hypothetical protein